MYNYYSWWQYFSAIKIAVLTAPSPVTTKQFATPYWWTSVTGSSPKCLQVVPDKIIVDKTKLTILLTTLTAAHGSKLSKLRYFDCTR